jgi:hypothetical protein
VALAIDRILFWVQRQLFPYQYGGDGLLHRGVRGAMRAWESFASLFISPVDVAAASFAQGAAKAPVPVQNVPAPRKEP